MEGIRMTKHCLHDFYWLYQVTAQETCSIQRSDQNAKSGILALSQAACRFLVRGVLQELIQLRR